MSAGPRDGTAGGGPPGRFPADAAAVAHVLVAVLGDAVVVDGPDGHHLQRVRRLRPGEPVTAADGTGAWRPYVVRESAAGRLLLEAAGEPELEPALRPALSVAVALTKGGRPELVVQGLTELGVDRVLVFHAARSVVRWDGPRAGTGLARLRRVAREAVLQCRRARLPVVDGPVALADLAGDPAAVVADRGGGGPAGLPPAPAGGRLLLVGPEGGFDDAERRLLAGVPRLGVGPHVLRSETAALAGAAVLAGVRTGAGGPPGAPGGAGPARET